MPKKTSILSLAIVLAAILSCGLAQATTVATFADPAADGSTPLFTVDLDDDVIIGGWPDSQPGLDLIIFGDPFEDAFFTMTEVTYIGGISGGDTGGGTIKFFENGQDTSTDPLIQIDFDTAHISPFNFGATDQFFPDGVTITGSEITGSLTDEYLAFSFVNHIPLGGDWNNGYTVTASFVLSAATSSPVPEPATIALLGLGALGLLRRKRSV